MVESVIDLPDLNEERKSTRIDVKLIHKHVDVGRLHEFRPVGNATNTAGSRPGVNKQSFL